MESKLEKNNAEIMILEGKVGNEKEGGLNYVPIRNDFKAPKKFEPV